MGKTTGMTFRTILAWILLTYGLFSIGFFVHQLRSGEFGVIRLLLGISFLLYSWSIFSRNRKNKPIDSAKT